MDLTKKKEEEPRTFQTLLIKKYKLELLEEALKDDNAARSEQATKADIVRGARRPSPARAGGQKLFP